MKGDCLIEDGHLEENPASSSCEIQSVHSEGLHGEVEKFGGDELDVMGHGFLFQLDVQGDDQPLQLQLGGDYQLCQLVDDEGQLCHLVKGDYQVCQLVDEDGQLCPCTWLLLLGVHVGEGEKVLQLSGGGEVGLPVGGQVAAHPN